MPDEEAEPTVGRGRGGAQLPEDLPADLKAFLDIHDRARAGLDGVVNSYLGGSDIVPVLAQLMAQDWYQAALFLIAATDAVADEILENEALAGPERDKLRTLRSAYGGILGKPISLAQRIVQSGFENEITDMRVCPAYNFRDGRAVLEVQFFAAGRKTLAMTDSIASVAWVAASLLEGCVDAVSACRERGLPLQAYSLEWLQEQQQHLADLASNLGEHLKSIKALPEDDLGEP